jgi:ubiquinone/menaquinone biosynthesis C-methylase UbiE
MAKETKIKKRIIEQYSYRSESSEIWKALGLFLDTGKFLNIGYSEWYQPYILGSCQLRLARKIGGELSKALGSTSGKRLLDVGCGRGGVTLEVEQKYGLMAVGLDLVEVNVRMAQDNAKRIHSKASFFVGDAMAMPFKDRSFHACICVGSLSYFPYKDIFFNELHRLLKREGVVIISALTSKEDLPREDTKVVREFAEVWDFAGIENLNTYKRMLRERGFRIIRVHDISKNSVSRLDKWARLYLSIARSPLNSWVRRFLCWKGIRMEPITEQVEKTHQALKFLRHVIICARKIET